jgi:hypothetical protein
LASYALLLSVWRVLAFERRSGRLARNLPVALPSCPIALDYYSTVAIGRLAVHCCPTCTVLKEMVLNK